MTQKPANPGALGLFAFALTTALLQGATTALTDGDVHYYVYAYAMFYGGLAQFVAGLWAFRRGEVFAASAFTSYGAFWMSQSLYGILTAANVFKPSTQGHQMLLALWGIVTFFFFLGTLAINMALQLLFISLAILFFLLAGGVTNPTCEKVAGWLGLFVAAVAFYAGLADLLNELYQSVVLPLGPCKPGVVMLPHFQRVVGHIPLLGPLYTRSVRDENKVAGYLPYDSVSHCEACGGDGSSPGSHRCDVPFKTSLDSSLEDGTAAPGDHTMSAAARRATRSMPGPY